MKKRNLEIKKVRGWWAVYAGVSKLSKGFRAESAAKKHLEDNRAFYSYWAGSGSVSYENRVAEGDCVTIYAG